MTLPLCRATSALLPMHGVHVRHGDRTTKTGLDGEEKNKQSREKRKQKKKAADRWPLAIEADLALVGN